LNSKPGKAGDTFGDYLQLVQLLDYQAIDNKFQLIDNETQSVFIPWNLPAREPEFSKQELKLLRQQNCYNEGEATISGEQVFGLYVNTVKNKSGDFIGDREARQRLQSVMSKFTISVYPQLAEKLRVATPKMDWNNYGFVYLHEPQHVYNYEEGLLAKGDFVSANIF
jgi:CRISPR-associated endonuclease/helicase Cas3